MQTMQAAAANQNMNSAINPTVVVESGAIVYRNLADKDSVLFGRKHVGRVNVGNHAKVEPGKRIVLWGVNRNHVKGANPYRIEFKIGDLAEYDYYNFAFIGTVTAITAKTVTVQAPNNGKRYRFSIYQFNAKNHDFDLNKLTEQRRNWMD